jgi:hypothetical protein
MAGDPNVAVVAFAAEAGQRGDQDEATALARQLDATLLEQLRMSVLGEPYLPEGVVPAVQLLDRAGSVTATEPASRAIELGTMARQRNADVLITGAVRHQYGSVTVRFETYLAGRLPDADDLLGLHSLGAHTMPAGYVFDDPLAGGELRQPLLETISAIVQLSVALSHAARGDEAAARAAFARTEGWASAHREALVELSLGNLEGRQGRFATARDHYTRALQVLPGYARAEIGLGEVAFQLAHGNCLPEQVDPSGCAKPNSMRLPSGSRSTRAFLPTKIGSVTCSP